MSTQSPSRVRNAQISATLADVVATVRAQSDLPDRRRQEMLSALATAARLLGRSIQEIPADPVFLGRRLAEIDPRSHDLSTGRWSNTRSLVRSALALAVPVGVSRNTKALNPEWAALRDRLTPRYRQLQLSRFMHLCSAMQIAPHEVDQGTFAMFREDLGRSLRKNPEETYSNACAAWNLAASSLGGWPSFQVARESRRQVWTLSWDSFPSSLRDDVSRWLDRLAGKDLLDDMSFRPVRPATAKARNYQLRQAASALVCRGRDITSIKTLGDLTNMEAYKEILRHLIARRDGKATGPVADMAAVLRSVARHYLHASPDELQAMTAVMRRLGQSNKGLTEKNRARLRPFMDPQTVRKLVTLPARLVADAERTRTPAAAARLVQVAVAIELLLMAPIRVGNLASLDFVRHVDRSRNGRQVSLVLTADEVKNREPLEFPLPADSVALLDLYVTRYQGVLARPGETALFPARKGGSKTGTALGPLISRTIQRYLGLTVHPHLFRHIAAKIYLDQHPGGYEVMRRVLGHRSMDTTTAFYTGLETAAAVRHFDESVLRLRQRAAA